MFFLVCDVEKRVYYNHHIKGPQALKLINSQFENSDSYHHFNDKEINQYG